jgi:hypothetical protein
MYPAGRCGIILFKTLKGGSNQILFLQPLHYFGLNYEKLKSKVSYASWDGLMSDSTEV